uniref:Carbohydrate sulfotransferase 4-like n=2 Tax=Hirondellea gigas TaxID=1518452 RepID=A0A2P2I056_9CRUS
MSTSGDKFPYIEFRHMERNYMRRGHPLWNQTKLVMRRLQYGLAPRSRHLLRIGLIVLGSALLLLAIFLLARLPQFRPDVKHPAMYNLPPDDAFRPQLRRHHVSFLASDMEDVPELPPLPQVDHPDVVAGGDVIGVHKEPIPLPNVNADLRALANRRGVAFHQALGVPVDESFLRMEASRRMKLRALSNVTVESVLQIVRKTVEAERKQMINKEKDIWAEGGTPLRILLVSTWRSGSTFLGQVLQQHPGVFQHYEPFSYFGIRQIRSGSDAFQSQQLLHRLLECRFAGQDEYLEYTAKNPVDMSGHNKRIWNACNSVKRIDICSNATFLTEACNMFPIQLVKTVRLRLNLTQLFLGETRLNAKVVFLVRDPRATMSSRRSTVDWCDSGQDCSSPAILCSDLKADLKVAGALELLYPKSFTMIKYEDLANNPQNVIKKLLQFLGMEYSKELSKFVRQHTESELDKPWSIARKSAARVSRWKEQLLKEEIENIEDSCKSVIEKLGYEMS